MSGLLSVVRAGEPHEASRGAVLDGALKTFIDVGIRRTSMGDIAKRAGVSPATLYRKFSGKPEVVQAVGLREVRRFLADVDDVVADAAARGADVETQIVDMSLAVLDGIRRNRLLNRLLETEPEVFLPFLTTEAGPVLALGRDYLADFIGRLQREGQVTDYDPAPVAELLARLALSMTLTPDTVIPLDDDNAARAFFRAHIVPAIARFS